VSGCSFCKLLGGGVSERPKEHASKACDGKTVRGFKSLRHRHNCRREIAGEQLIAYCVGAMFRDIGLTEA
jgi:hypothetical protein